MSTRTRRKPAPPDRPSLPDPRNYAEPVGWLVAWCAAQPDRSTNEKLEELARLADCSDTNIQQVIRGARRLSPNNARSLVRQLPLEPEQRAHLLDLFALQHATPKLAGERRKIVLDRVAKQGGLTGGAPDALIEDGRTDASASAALSAAIACLEEDLPTLRTLLRSAVPAMTLQQLERAAELTAPATRLGPRFVSVHAPSSGRLARLAHQASLSFALDGLMRLRSAERDFQCLVASIDEECFQALEAPCRRLEAGLIQLADDSQVRLPDVVVLHQHQRLLPAGPVVTDGSGLTWRLADPVGTGAAVAPRAPEAGARPHPAGFTHFPTWVAWWRRWAEQVGQGSSDAWFAQRTGLSRATVYDLSTGTSRFQSQHVFPFLEAFGLVDDQAAKVALEGMVLVADGEGDLDHQARLIAALRGQGLDVGARHLATEAHFVRARWLAHLIFMMTDLSGFQSSPAWLGRVTRGRIDAAAAEELLTALTALGLMRRGADGQLEAAAPELRVEGPHVPVAQYELYRGLLAQHRTDLDLGAADLQPTTWLLALPENALARLDRLRDTWRAETYAVLQAAEARRQMGAPMDRVVVVSSESFPLFKLPPPRPRRPLHRPPRARQETP